MGLRHYAQQLFKRRALNKATKAKLTKYSYIVYQKAHNNIRIYTARPGAAPIRISTLPPCPRICATLYPYPSLSLSLRPSRTFSHTVFVRCGSVRAHSRKTASRQPTKRRLTYTHSPTKRVTEKDARTGRKAKGSRREGVELYTPAAVEGREKESRTDSRFRPTPVRPAAYIRDCIREKYIRRPHS